MIQEDIKKLVANLISSNALSSSFSEKFNSSLQTDNSNSLKPLSYHKTIVGIYYLYLFQLFNEKNKLKLVDNQKVIESSVEKFNNNSLSSDEAKNILDELINQNNKLELIFEKNKQGINVLPYSTSKNTIEIEKMFSNLVKFSLLESEDIKKLFLTYFDKFEKNKDILKAFETNRELTSEEFSHFLDSILQSLDQQDSLVDKKGLNETFTAKLVSLFENYFLTFKQKEFQPIDFNINIGKMLGDKNNESYFFYGDELEKLGQQIQQPYVSQLEINSKINASTINSSLPNSTTLWEMVGAIVENPVKKGLGIARFPYLDTNTNKVYISAVVEQEIDLSESDNFYHQIQSMRISEVSDKTDSRRRLVVNEIADSLDIPPELALYPSIIEEYLVRNKGVSIDFEIKKKILRYEFYPAQEIVFDKLNGIITVPDDIEPTTSHQNFTLLPSPRQSFIDNKNVSLANEKTIGKTSTEFTIFNSWYVLIELDLPSSAMINKISTKLRKSDDKEQNDLWKLRFTISKVLDIFEAESLLPVNLWKYIWHEKIPVFPFTLLTSFLGFVPSGAVNKESISNESIQLARGIEIEHISALIQEGPYVLMSEQKITIGKAISFYFNPQDKQIFLLYCDINEIDILRKLNRDTAQNSLVKLSKRITKALDLKFEKLEELLHPKFLLTYVLFYSIQFNTQIDFTNVYDVLHWLIGEFEMKYCPIEKIKSIDPENYIIQVEL